MNKEHEFLLLLFNLIPGSRAMYSMDICKLREILKFLEENIKNKIIQDFKDNVNKSTDSKGMLQFDSSEDDD